MYKNSIKMLFETFRCYYVKKVYGDHNSSRNVKKIINKVLGEIPKNGKGLNVGSGNTKIDSRIKNLDIFDGDNIDYVGKAESIPIANNSLDLIICQEVLEHIEDYSKALDEFHRVLRSEGKLYLQLPFIIGYHPCPSDYWRFTKEGISQMVLNKNFQIIDQGITVGSATGFYRISVEFFSILLSTPFTFLYKPLKGIFALLLFPIKWLDRIMKYSPSNHKISGGFFVLCEKY